MGLLLIMLLAGAVIMPGNKAFQALHSIPLFEWIQRQPYTITWWLWCIIGVLVIITINTISCSIESIVRKRKVTQWLLLISPQIIHIGFLFMLLAHLLSSIGAYQEMVYGREGTSLRLAGSDTVMKVKDIDIRFDYYGYITDWQVDIDYTKGKDTLQTDIIKPNKPSTYNGLNVNVKNLRAYPEEVILIQLNREPGAIWALIGGILFMVGIVTLIALKIKLEK